MYIRVSISVLVSLLVAGCITDPVAVENDFGLSVKQMVDAQIYDPAAASNPDVNALEILDGVSGSEMLTGYRADGKRKSSRAGVDFTLE